MKVRTVQRTHLIYHLRVFDAQDGHLLGHMTDIDAEGMMLIGENPITVNQVFSVRMDLPQNVMASRQLRFTVESKWCRRDAGVDFYSMGFRLVDIDAEGLSVVRQLTEYFYQEDIAENPQADMNPSL